MQEKIQLRVVIDDRCKIIEREQEIEKQKEKESRPLSS